MSIYSLQIEKYTISGLIKHPEAFADIESFINEKDFINEVHYTIAIYSVHILQSLLCSQRKP
jgi:replicative DNA helicase